MSLYEIPSFLWEIPNTESITTKQRFCCVLQRKHPGLRGREQMTRVDGRTTFGGRRVWRVSYTWGRGRSKTSISREKIKSRFASVEEIRIYIYDTETQDGGSKKRGGCSAHRESTH